MTFLGVFLINISYYFGGNVKNLIDNSLSALLHRTFIRIEMAGYPGPDDEDEDGGQDEGEEGGHRHPVVLIIGNNY